MMKLPEIRRALAAATAIPKKDLSSSERLESFWRAIADRDDARRALDAKSVEYIQYLLDIVDGRPGLRARIYEAFSEGSGSIPSVNDLVEYVKEHGYAHEAVWDEVKRLTDEGEIGVGVGGFVRLSAPQKVSP